MADKIKKPSAGEVARIGQISMTIRQALRAALPAPAEQFFTMMVPGKVVNFDVGVFSILCVFGRKLTMSRLGLHPRSRP